jgi:tRNASer (uridine44-2'-O)-methyltransferase
MDEQRARYIHGRRGHPVSPPGKEHSCSAPEVAAGSAGHQDSPASLGSGTECVPEALPAEQGAGTQAAAVWLPGFQPREKAEPVRNCATLPRDFVDQVVLQVADLLLAGKKLNTASSQEGSLKTWNGGGRPPTTTTTLLTPSPGLVHSLWYQHRLQVS